MTKTVSKRRSRWPWPALSRFPLEWGSWPWWIPVLAYFAYAVASVTVVTAMMVLPSLPPVSWQMVAQQSAMALAAVLVPVLAARRFAPAHVGLRSVPLWRIVAGAVAFVAVFTVAERLWQLVDSSGGDNVATLQGLGMGKSFFAEVGIVLALTIVAPLGEELLFRGVLYRSIRDVVGRWSRPAGMVIAALLSGYAFADVHSDENFTVGLLVMFMLMAVLLTVLYEWSGSLLVPMAAHSANNALVILVAAGAGAAPTKPWLLAVVAVAPVITVGVGMVLRRWLPTIDLTKTS